MVMPIPEFVNSVMIPAKNVQEEILINVLPVNLVDSSMLTNVLIGVQVIHTLIIKQDNVKNVMQLVLDVMVDLTTIVYHAKVMTLKMVILVSLNAQLVNMEKLYQQEPVKIVTEIV